MILYVRVKVGTEYSSNTEASPRHAGVSAGGQSSAGVGNKKGFYRYIGNNSEIEENMGWSCVTRLKTL